MSSVLRTPNGNAVLLTPRSASHSLAQAAMTHFWPHIACGEWHPAAYFGVQEEWDGANKLVALIVRNPIERFRSMCAHRPERSLAQHLASPVYGPLPRGNFVRYFRFEDELGAAAEWLGLPLPLPHEDATDPAAKPVLTPEQNARVREIFADDVRLWESL